MTEYTERSINNLNTFYFGIQRLHFLSYYNFFVSDFQLMKQMSSTDTPLGTLQMLQQKQKETQSAFVVLSGSKQTALP